MKAVEERVKWFLQNDSVRSKKLKTSYKV